MRIAARRNLLETSTIEPGLLALNNSSLGANSTGGFFVDAENEEGKQRANFNQKKKASAKKQEGGVNLKGRKR